MRTRALLRTTKQRKCPVDWCNLPIALKTTFGLPMSHNKQRLRLLFQLSERNIFYVELFWCLGRASNPKSLETRSYQPLSSKAAQLTHSVSFIDARQSRNGCASDPTG